MRRVVCGFPAENSSMSIGSSSSTRREHPDKEVDWSLYEDWGGRNVICDPDTKFDVWWRQNWKTLFGYKIGEEDKILYPLSKRPSGETIRPKAHGIRYALMVYELKHTPLLDGDDLTDMENVGDGKVGDAWEIAKWIAKREFPKRRNKTSTDPSYDPERLGLQYCEKVYCEEVEEGRPRGVP